MKNITSLLVLLLLVSVLPVSAQENTELSRLDGSLLWKISGNGLADPSYILGTHHLVELDAENDIAGLQDVLASVDQVAGEVVLIDKDAINQVFTQHITMPADTTYRDILTEEEYTALDMGLRKILHIGLDELGMVKPGMASMLYSVVLYKKVNPEFDPLKHEALDAYVQRIALDAGKVVIGLETVEDQIFALTQAEPLRDQALSLLCSVQNEELSEQVFRYLEEYYLTAQLQKIYDLSFNSENDPCPMSKKQQNAINKNRNDKWLDKLPQIMGEKSTLIAVGVLHVAGEDGLLYRLSQMGYMVEPVK